MNFSYLKTWENGTTNVYDYKRKKDTSVEMLGGGHIGLCVYWSPGGNRNLIVISFANLGPIPTYMQNFKNISLKAQCLWMPAHLYCE